MLTSLLVIATPCLPVHAACAIADERPFPTGTERVRFAAREGGPATARFALFSAPLAVNTDGAPTSYHPKDFRGQKLAINRIDNGVTFRAVSGQSLSTAQKEAAFARWRDGGFTPLPDVQFTWKNVIAAGSDGKPCIFRSGPHAGYFGSLTAVRNGLVGSAAGECGVNDQLDQRFIPAIVLRGGSANPLHQFGARPQDLVLAINPATGAAVPAIVGDTGNANRIGEGSVALNMALLGRTVQPATFTQAVGLDTGNRAMIVATLPGSRSLAPAKPFSADNIRARVEAWAKANGYGNIAGLASAVTACAAGL